jgi:sugar O-acyltransferase (sialic acid O-acetyltransferase NeuD family)
MSEAKNENGELLSDEERLGRFGRLLRSLSLDELPQLINILRGEMSFVGPRPLLIEYLPRYDAFQARRHEVKPGITGLAQVSGRNAQSWQKRFECDAYYAQNLSFRLDLTIAFLTIYKVLKRDGVSEEGSATKEPFLGNGDRVFIYGGGGHGRVAADTARRSGFRVEGAIDGEAQRGISYAEFLQKARFERFAVALGVGENAARRTIAEKLRKDRVEIVSLIDPSAVVSPSAHIGEGAVIFANATINDRARIEEGAIINSGAIVEHDCVVGAYAHISPNAALAGGAKVGTLAHIGIGASLLQKAIVGKAAIVGAGSVVLREVSPFATAVGVPAREIKRDLNPNAA